MCTRVDDACGRIGNCFKETIIVFPREKGEKVVSKKKKPRHCVIPLD